MVNKSSDRILIGDGSPFSNSVAKWVLLIFGCYYFIIGTADFYNNGFTFESAGWIMVGISAITYGVLFYTNLAISPKVIFDEEGILLKPTLLKKPKKLKWNKIISIKYERYKITFEHEEGSHIFSYRSNPKISIRMKQKLREFAGQNDIEVFGG